MIASVVFSILCISFFPLNSERKKIQWNDSKINWISYEEGMKDSLKNGRPVLLILYAEWCPACKTYAKVFFDENIQKLSHRFSMIRVDIDQNPELSRKYSVDGEYIPRTYFLYPDGRLMETIYPQIRYRFFIGSRVENVKWFMEDALDED